MKTTSLYDIHKKLGADMTEFAGWQMPIKYSAGIIQEHLAVRRRAGVFDVSHMGRFSIKGSGACGFLRYLLTNDAGKLDPGESHYTILADKRGSAIDDCWLCRTGEDEYNLIVNAVNSEKDFSHIVKTAEGFDEVRIEDKTNSLAMLSLQGPQSGEMLGGLAENPADIPERRNALGMVNIRGVEISLSRTGYTGEANCFELMFAAEEAGNVWNVLTEAGAEPIGLGARDTLRLEASLPLYGHEMGADIDGKIIPVFAAAQARFGVDISDTQRDFIGKSAVIKQQQAVTNQTADEDSPVKKKIIPFALLQKSIARQGCGIYVDKKPAGYVTSGTMVPFYEYEEKDGEIVFKNDYNLRPVGLAYVNAETGVGTEVEIQIRNKRMPARLVKKNIKTVNGKFTAAVIHS